MQELELTYRSRRGMLVWTACICYAASPARVVFGLRASRGRLVEAMEEIDAHRVETPRWRMHFDLELAREGDTA
jgi:hypothetical protein